MSNVVTCIENMMLLLGDESLIQQHLDETMKSEYLGDALCMKIYADLFLQRENPQMYEQLCADSDYALNQYQYEGELERNQQYRAHIEMEAGHYEEALQWLFKSALIVYEEDNIAAGCQQYLDKADREDYVSQSYYLMYYIEIFTEAALHGQEYLADMMYQKLSSKQELWTLLSGEIRFPGTNLVHENDSHIEIHEDVMEDIIGNEKIAIYHPMEIVYWKLATYQAVKGNNGASTRWYEKANSLLYNLLLRYLHISIETDGKITNKTKGLVQGSPLSPFLSNLYLNQFDHELEKMDFRFCRYGDDINIYFKSKASAEEAFKVVTSVLTDKYHMTINKEKSGIYEGLKRKYLGYSFLYEKKAKKVIAVHNTKTQNECYTKWNKDCIQKIDKNYHIINNGILTKHDYTILFENEDGKKYIPVEASKSINVYSNVIFSGNFFEFMNRERLSVNLFDKYGNRVGSFVPESCSSSGTTMLKQAALYMDINKRLQIARAFEIGAMHNIRSNLRYYQKQKKSTRLNDGIEEISNIIKEFNEIQKMEDMLLIEARARQGYYQLFNEIIAVEDFKFTTRSRRPPQDPLNALISFGNTYLYNRVATEINKTSLDIRIGFVHSTNNCSQSLNLDIAEIFKPIIVDRTIFTLINKRMISTQQHFQTLDGGGIYLNADGKRLFLNALDDKMYQKQTEGNKSINYDARIREEVSKIFQQVYYDKKYKPYKYY